ncbi:MAG: hypothetical protein HQRvContig02_35 [Haloquadratum phage sp.]|nr:MAG: hypothetical protein HQRvContig02_35 [Haloquadratum phage sp.]
MSDKSESEDPQFETDSVDDLAELLGRAANWAERDCGADVIAAELRDGAEFVEEEISAEPELVTDGGVDQSEAEADRDSVTIPEDEFQELYSTLADATSAAATGHKNRCASLAADAKQQVLVLHKEYTDD